MIREAGNIQAFGARAQGEPTKVVGLTWVDEAQTIVALPASDIREPKDLKGKRLALPSWLDHPIAAHQKASSIARGMSLQGYRGALASAGLALEDVKLIEVDGSYAARAQEVGSGTSQLAALWSFHALLDDKVDAIYVKGAAAIEAARKFGLSSAIALDQLPDRRFRINNGTPRPITVHEDLIENHYEIVVRFLVQTLKASAWAAANLAEVRKILEAETRASADAVRRAYTDEALQGLHPTLDDDRIELFERQKNFLWVHGFLDHDFALAPWIDRRPLEDAQRRFQDEL